MNFKFVFYCYVTNHHKVTGLKQQPCIIAVFMGQESENNSFKSSAQDFTRLQSRYWLELGSQLRLKVLLQTHVFVGKIHCLGNSFFKASRKRNLTSSTVFFQGRPGTSFKGIN